MNSRILGARCLRQLSNTSFLPRPFVCHARLLSGLPVSRDNNAILVPKVVTHNLQLYRFKSKKKTQKVEDDSDSDSDSENENEGEMETSGKNLAGEQEKILKIAQLRIDKVTKMALGNSKKVLDGFLEGRLYKNDVKVLKKASLVQENDIIDLEIGPDPKNPDYIKVDRVEIVEIKAGVHSQVRVLVSRNLTVLPFNS